MFSEKLKRYASYLVCFSLVFVSLLTPVLFTAAESESITVDRVLSNFDNCEIGTVSNNNPLPDNISNLSAYKGTARFYEAQEGHKQYEVLLDKKVTNSSNSASISARTYIALSVDIPEKYAPYLDSLHVDIKNNIKNSTKPKEKSYYIVGITDQSGNYGKTCQESEQLSYNYDGTISKNISDMIHISGSTSFLGNSTSKVKWTSDKYATIKQILVYVTLPDCKGNEGYSVSIGNIGITLKGEKEKIEHIDDIDQDLTDFDDADTLAELSENGDFSITTGPGEFTLTDDAQSAPNALKYQSKTDSVNYDTAIHINLIKRSADCAGIEFYVKNLDESSPASIRCILVTGEGHEQKKYQYLKDVFPSENGDYTKVKILFADVGITNDEFWGGTSSDYSMTAREIEQLRTLRIRLPYIDSKHAGIAFDSFRLLTEQDLPRPEDMTRRLLDFDDCDIGGELPENVTVTDNYGGTMGVVLNEYQSKSYRINYDRETELSAANQIGGRSHVRFQVTIPKTTLKGAKEIRIGVTNNAINCENNWTAFTNIYQVVGIAGGGHVGKVEENAGRVPNKGSPTEIKSPLDKMCLASSLGSLTGWSGSKTYWTASQLSEVTNVYFYITAPTCEGNEGWSFDINYIDIYYDDAAQNYEETTRYAIKTDRISSENNDYISAEQVKIGKNDPNYTMFTTALKLKLHSAKPQPLRLINAYTNYYSDLKQFKDTATLGFYMQADCPLTINLILEDKAGETLQVSFETEPSKNALTYGAYQMPFADIYDQYLLNNPEGTFNISDIRSISVLPVTDAALPDTFMLSGLSIWTKEIGSAVVYSGYHYTNNGVTVDAYNDYLAMETVTEIESEDVATAVKNFEIKFPKELTPIAFKTITLFSAAGSVIEPTGKIWISFEVDPAFDLSEISLYRVFFDGSYVKERYVVEDGNISINTFNTGSFMIVKGKLTGENAENDESLADASDSFWESLWDDNEDDWWDDEENESNGSTPTTKIIRKIIRKVVRKKGNGNNGLATWMIVIIITGSAIVVTAVAITFFIVAKKRKKGGKVK